jgi:hypothetical protein
MLTKNQLAQEIQDVLSEDGVTIPLRNIKEALDGLSVVAHEQIEAGEDFTVPGVCKIAYAYTVPRKKGEKYIGFGGEEVVADKARPEKIRIRASAVGSIKKLLPNKGTKPYKNVVGRKKK